MRFNVRNMHSSELAAIALALLGQNIRRRRLDWTEHTLSQCDCLSSFVYKQLYVHLHTSSFVKLSNLP